VTKPSDDPLAATRVLQARTEISNGQQFLKSINQAKTFLEFTEQSLGELTEVVNRAKELALSQANDPSSSPNTRQATASEIDQLFSQAVQIGNRKLADRFLFGGFKTTHPPFDAQGQYSGDNGEIKISVQKEGSVAMNMPGSRIFLGRDVKAPATAGPGPTQTFIAPSSGPGAKAPEAPGTSPTRGPASLPSERAVGHVSDQILNKRSDHAPKEAAPEESSSASSSGVPGGGYNVFHVLRDLSTALRADDKETIQESLNDLDGTLSQVVLARAQLGSRVSTMNSAVESIQKDQVEEKTLQSNLQDVDTFELVSDMNKTEGTLKASLATSGKLIQPSLLDFLR
jgi:flagellar hook-associated protein 3 FlgL